MFVGLVQGVELISSTYEKVRCDFRSFFGVTVLHDIKLRSSPRISSIELKTV